MFCQLKHQNLSRLRSDFIEWGIILFNITVVIFISQGKLIVNLELCELQQSTVGNFRDLSRPLLKMDRCTKKEILLFIIGTY